MRLIGPQRVIARGARCVDEQAPIRDWRPPSALAIERAAGPSLLGRKTRLLDGRCARKRRLTTQSFRCAPVLSQPPDQGIQFGVERIAVPASGANANVRHGVVGSGLHPCRNQRGIAHQFLFRTPRALQGIDLDQSIGPFPGIANKELVAVDEVLGTHGTHRCHIAIGDGLHGLGNSHWPQFGPECLIGALARRGSRVLAGAESTTKGIRRGDIGCPSAVTAGVGLVERDASPEIQGVGDLNGHRRHGIHIKNPCISETRAVSVVHGATRQVGFALNLHGSDVHDAGLLRMLLVLGGNQQWNQRVGAIRLHSGANHVARGEKRGRLGGDIARRAREGVPLTASRA